MAVKFLATLRKSQERFRKTKLPKWEDCSKMSAEEFNLLFPAHMSEPQKHD